MRRIVPAACLLAALGAAPVQAAEPDALPPLAALACGGCHGVGSRGAYPIDGIAGRPAEQIVTALMAFRADDRPATIMNRIARGYTESEIAAIAAWLAAQR